MAQTKKKHNEEKRREEAVERKTKIIKSKDTASIKKLRERDERKQVHRPKTTTEAALAVGLFARSTWTGKGIGDRGEWRGDFSGTCHTQAEGEWGGAGAGGTVGRRSVGDPKQMCFNFDEFAVS